MKSVKSLCIACTLFGASEAVFAQTPPALYSFEDVYRLAIAGPVPAVPVADAAIHPVALQTQVAAPVEPHFTVEKLPAPQGWLLVLAGLAAAGWVAHRRLAQL